MFPLAETTLTKQREELIHIKMDAGFTHTHTHTNLLLTNFRDALKVQISTHSKRTYKESTSFCVHVSERAFLKHAAKMAK